jgi:anti-sigma regulatory factor (Ser/Thr protein kinase)
MRADGFRHEALLYRSNTEFLDATSAFIKQGVAEGAPTLVVVDAGKIEQLRSVLGADADAVEFADMATVGQNPARIIPAWREFVDRHQRTGRGLRGIGEPIWPGRGRDELVECRHHEALLNVAFADTPSFWLRCPYNATALDPAVVQEAHGTHPFVSTTNHRGTSSDYGGTDPHELFQEPLSAPPAHASRLHFTQVAPVRRFVAGEAETSGLDRRAITDVVLAVGEVTTNSLRYGGGTGTVSLWVDSGTFVCQVEDHGHILDPLAGRRSPGATQPDGRGLWIANQLCRLLQIRTSADGTTIRLHFHVARDSVPI